MAIFGWATKPLLWLLPAFFVLGMAGGRAGTALRERVTERQCLFLCNSLAAGVALAIVKAAAANREIMDIVLWKRALLRGLMLLAVGLNAASSYIALDSVAEMFLPGGDPAAVQAACAFVAVAAHLRLGWVAVFED